MADDPAHQKPPSGRHKSDLCVQIVASARAQSVEEEAWPTPCFVCGNVICEFLLKSFASRRIPAMPCNLATWNGNQQLFSSWHSLITKEKLPKTNTKRLTWLGKQITFIRETEREGEGEQRTLKWQTTSAPTHPSPNRNRNDEIHSKFTVSQVFLNSTLIF